MAQQVHHYPLLTELINIPFNSVDRALDDGVRSTTIEFSQCQSLSYDCHCQNAFWFSEFPNIFLSEITPCAEFLHCENDPWMIRYTICGLFWSILILNCPISQLFHFFCSSYLSLNIYFGKKVLKKESWVWRENLIFCQLHIFFIYIQLNLFSS